MEIGTEYEASVCVTESEHSAVLLKACSHLMRIQSVLESASFQCASNAH